MSARLQGGAGAGYTSTMGTRMLKAARSKTVSGTFSPASGCRVVYSGFTIVVVQAMTSIAIALYLVISLLISCEKLQTLLYIEPDWLDVNFCQTKIMTS